MIYLGIDPGLTATGVGMIDDGGYLAHHTVRPKDEDTLSRLEEISVGLFGFLREKEVVGAGIFHKGILIAIEMPFWTPVTRNGKALMSQALTVGYLLAALGEVSDHEIREVHPNVVKRAVTGWGGGGFGRGRKPAPTKRQIGRAHV